MESENVLHIAWSSCMFITWRAMLVLTFIVVCACMLIVG